MGEIVGARILTVTIANGASLSDAAAPGNGKVVGIQLPTFTSASLTFQGSFDGVTFANLRNADGTTETSVGATVGDLTILAPAALEACAFIKVRSGTAAAPVNQGAARTIQLIVK